MTAPTDDKDLAEVLRLFFQVLDLSRDVDRNKDDAVFRAGRGTIDYVFDATVMEVFVNPHDPRGWATSLHSSHWAGAGQDRAAWRSYTAQTALSTAEYLLDGGLPGQQRDRIYMTEWHRWELKRRVDSLHLEQIRRLRRAQADQVLQRFNGVRDALHQFDTDPDHIESHLIDDELKEDVAAFRAWRAKPDELRAYIGTRLSLSVLANDELMEPAEQLRRLVTSPLRQAVATLHLHFQPNETDRREIAADANEWMQLLLDECDIRGVEVLRKGEAGGDKGQRRHEAALRDDARSLALVRWAANKTAKESLTERVVFVTADALMFDTYRRWYANLQPNDPAYAEPFILRRIGQYAPVFNLLDSRKVEGERYLELFKDLQQVLELILLPLNLSRLVSRAPEIVVSRMREMTALRLTDPAPIQNDLAYATLVSAVREAGVEAMRERITDLIDRWRRLERAALGQADQQVDRRVQVFEKNFTGLAPGASKEAFERYVSNLVKTLIDGSREMSLPLAREFIDEWRPPLTPGIARAPIALRLNVQVGESEIAVGEVLDDRVAGKAQGPIADEEGWQALYRQPALVFAIAAAQCLTSHDWSNAQHFSEMALVADQEEVVEAAVETRNEQSAEIKYLAALVKRFRIGEIGAPLSAEAFIRIERAHRGAAALLDACVEYHQLAPGPRQVLRSMRALSERAALNLFYSSALNPTIRLGVLKRRSRYRSHAKADLDAAGGLLDFGAEDHAIRALARAERDLRDCMDMDRSLNESLDARRAEFRRKVQRQYFTNIASAGVLRALWPEAPEGTERMLLPTSLEATNRVGQVIERYGAAAHPLMRTECWAFLALAGDRDASRNLSKVESLAPQVSHLGALNLDSAIMDAVRQSDQFRN